jgi:hypothetical protein
MHLCLFFGIGFSLHRMLMLLLLLLPPILLFPEG